MIRFTLSLLLLSSILLVGCDSKETSTEETASTTTTTEANASPAAAVSAAADSTPDVPADWKTVESPAYGIQFAHPPDFKVITDQLKESDKDPMYVAGNGKLTIAVVPYDKKLTSDTKLMATSIFDSMAKVLKLESIKKEAPIEQKDSGGFTSWTDVNGSANYEGKPYTVTSGAGTSNDKAKSNVGLFVLYPEGEKNDEVYAQVYSSLVTLE